MNVIFDVILYRLFLSVVFAATDTLIFPIVGFIVIYLSIHLFIPLRSRSGFSPADTVAIMFCSTHKSLTLGKKS